MKTKQYYKSFWIAIVDLSPENGYDFNELVEPAFDFPVAGACANIILKTDSVFIIPQILRKGLKEKHFKIKFIFSIENLYFLVKSNRINPEIIKEAEWLHKSRYSFLISDKIWAYQEE